MDVSGTSALWIEVGLTVNFDETVFRMLRKTGFEEENQAYKTGNPDFQRKIRNLNQKSGFSRFFGFINKRRIPLMYLRQFHST